MVDFNAWTEATGALPYGAQRVMHDALELVAEGKLKMTYGADFGPDGSVCLVNATGKMLAATGGKTGSGLPSKAFGDVVSAFDQVNRDFYESSGYKEPGVVSPFAAEILLRHFGTLKEQPIEHTVKEATATAAFENGVYVEPSDEEFARNWLTAISNEAPEPDGPSQAESDFDEMYATHTFIDATNYNTD